MQAAPAEDTLIGYVLADKYRILRQIGRGGMGVVYEAEHVELGKRVAIKLMLDKYAEDGEATARFRREAFAASRIGNPHIIDVSDFGTSPEGRPFVVMELLSGNPLSKIIEMSGALPPWRAIPIMRQVLRAVGAAHAKGIIHRDLKPDNIFILSHDDHQDFVKLLDFGISKVVDPDEQVAFTKLTTTGVVMGTPLYMAPEQAMGQPIERYADIYACGVILYEMLAGKPPFEGATYAHLVAKLITQPAPLLGDVRPGLPGALVAAVHRALEKEPKDRFHSAEQFLLALPGEKTPSMIELESTMHDSSSGGVPAVSPPTIKRAAKRWPLFAVLALGLAAAAAVTVVVLNKDPANGSVSALAEPAPAAGSAPAPTPPTPPVVTPVPVAHLAVKSTPLGATVYIDDQPKGPTPIDITLEPGKYKLRVELAGHVPYVDEQLELREGERSSTIVPLVKETAGKRSSTRSKPDVKKTSTIEPAAKAGPQPVDPFPEPKKPETKKPATKTSGGSKPNPYD